MGLLDLYDGFYLENEVKFTKGLQSTGLINPSFTSDDIVKMKGLFRNHFGSSLNESMKFNLMDFQRTFLKIFEFLMEKKVMLSSEFMLFGIYLVTLYLSLEKSGEKHDVRKLYLEVRSGLQSGS
jgi:hypothetical protein